MDGDGRLTFEAAGRSVSVLWAEAAQPVAAAAIAHGAGAGMTHPFMAGVAHGLVASGVSVLRFNFPYIEARRRAPDPLRVLLDTWRAAMQQVSRLANGLPVIAGGKSMGGRIASMLAAADGSQFAGAALVFFGYPLHPPGRVDQLRDGHLSSITVPTLFIQGDRDRLARLDLIEAVVAKLRPLARLHIVAGGDHSFRVPARKDPDLSIGGTLGRVAGAFIRDVIGASPPAPGSRDTPGSPGAGEDPLGQVNF
jgi:uncharacterized protein